MGEQETIRIGGASGYWGDWDGAAAQLLAAGDVDYLVFDYLAEITMSIMARARAKNPEIGYAVDFVGVVKANLDRIRSSGAKILSNAGGVNPEGCAAALHNVIDAAGADLKVAVLTGDDLTDRADRFKDKTEMFSGAMFPDPRSVVSINAYLGAGPVAAALKNGADIVITGRSVDSALTLAACIHAFDWRSDDWDLLAAGSLAGHLLECGAQATGGNFTDWESVAETLHEVGYPIAVMSSDGGFEVTKPAETGGAVTAATVAEQMLYEICDPQSYILPDVVCDFSEVRLEEIAETRVAVSGAKGRPPSGSYKTSVTFEDGWKVSTLWFFIGEGAEKKADAFAGAAFRRANARLDALGLGAFSETLAEPVGVEAHFGACAEMRKSREIAVKIAAKHDNRKALEVLVKEAIGLALSAPPGLSLYAGARPKPSPVVRLFSMLVDKRDVSVAVHMNGETRSWTPDYIHKGDDSAPEAHVPPDPYTPSADNIEVPLRRLAWARSGDKGDKANIGVIARKAIYFPWIWAQLTEDRIQDRFAHFLKGGVDRYYLPGVVSMNIVLHDVLGGGGMASLRTDPQGKSYAQILLDAPIRIPSDILEGADNGRV